LSHRGHIHRKRDPSVRTNHDRTSGLFVPAGEVLAHLLQYLYIINTYVAAVSNNNENYDDMIIRNAYIIMISNDLTVFAKQSENVDKRVRVDTLLDVCTVY